MGEKRAGCRKKGDQWVRRGQEAERKERMGSGDKKQ
jgi:hypothetical protein